jgi:hypothetical protein
MAKRIVTIRLEIEEADYQQVMALPGPARTPALLMQRAMAAAPEAVAAAVGSLSTERQAALQTAQAQAAAGVTELGGATRSTPSP